MEGDQLGEQDKKEGGCVWTGFTSLRIDTWWALVKVELNSDELQGML